MKKKKHGFTLAEVLITLAVIGVVAAMTLPTLISRMHTKAMERKEQMFKVRLVQGLRDMAVKSRLTNFDSTYEFAQELSNHYKIFNICNSDNIQACYQVDEVTDSNEDTLKVSSIKTIKHLNLKNENGNEWLAPVAIVTTDGTPFIFSYNKNCSLTESDINKGETENGNAVITHCIAGVYDRNGVKAPNKMNDDVISFRGGTLTDSSSLTVPYVKFVEGNKTYYVSQELTASDGLTYNGNSADWVTWKEASPACTKNGGRLPTLDELKIIYKHKDELILNNPYWGFWSSTDTTSGNNKTYGVINFANGKVLNHANHADNRVLCLGM